MEGKSQAATLEVFSNEVARVVENVSRAVVAINARQRIPSSGVHWRQGLIVTADHTVKRDEEITVTLPDGKTVPATLVGREPGTDLAVLKLSDVTLPVADVGDAASLRVGHLVFAVGRAGELSASLGMIGALGGSYRPWRGVQIDCLIRLDLAIYDGFSGSPLVDVQGRVVGINTSGLWRGTPVAIPASTVDRVTAELKERGRIARGYLGVGLQPVPLPDALRSKLNLPEMPGMIVLTVEPDGPAGKAGLLIGDVLLSIGGRPLRDLGDVQAMLGSEQVGKTVGATLLRAGEPFELQITVGERPQRKL